MYVSPAYLRAITIAGPTSIAAATCVVLHGGAARAFRIALVIPIAIVLGAVSGTVTVAAAAGLGSSEHPAARP